MPVGDLDGDTAPYLLALKTSFSEDINDKLIDSLQDGMEKLASVALCYLVMKPWSYIILNATNYTCFSNIVHAFTTMADILEEPEESTEESKEDPFANVLFCRWQTANCLTLLVNSFVDDSSQLSVLQIHYNTTEIDPFMKQTVDNVLRFIHNHDKHKSQELCWDDVSD